MESPKINLESLPSKVYLTLGTTEQIQFLLKKAVKLLYEPTTEEMRQEMQHLTPFDNPNVVIWPKVRTATGSIRKTGTLKTDNKYAIPTDQFVNVAPGKKIFILFCGYDGEVRANDKTAAKKIEGGIFEILDLRKQTLPSGNTELDEAHKAYPITLIHKKQQLRYISPVIGFTVNEFRRTPEFTLVNSLRTKAGVLEWGRLSAKDITKYFCIPGLRCPLLISRARAWTLLPYLEPLLRGNDEGQLISPAKLQEFALWVYFSSTYYADTYNPGLGTYTPKGKGEYFTFKPSLKAKHIWSIMIQGISLIPPMKKAQRRD
jgi:hypothetical protein